MLIFLNIKYSQFQQNIKVKLPIWQCSHVIPSQATYVKAANYHHNF